MGAALQRAEHFDGLPDFKRVRILLRDDLHGIVERRLVTVRQLIPRLKDGPHVLGVPLANVSIELAAQTARLKGVGNAIVLKILIEITGLQADLSGTSRDADDVSSGLARPEF